jgi:hypothetical protein
MSNAGWHVRPAIPDDRKLLASFACADPAVRWQAEVEQFIQAQLIDWAFDPHADAGDPRLLLAFTTAGGLFGVAAHERVTLRAGDGTSFPATKLEVVGVALGWQGRSFQRGAARQRRHHVGCDDRREFPCPASRRAGIRRCARRQPPQPRRLSQTRAH